MRYEMLFKNLIPNVLYTIQTSLPLEMTRRNPNLFNSMQTVIGYKAPNFMNCIKLDHKAFISK